ncbi:30S ribosomal protein S12 methylthiotransferase RimO [Acidiferrimicrobium sp. IK]|uniref:30S ribosomal protein S12 methylthiotransferase RimO n=1 Tax=Acidiferrimicrobium sp. IK TaxID=2871700 RepID=UPI0021CB3537|nr:30S ribosomal protein S12 methylthiotransferase RimO [Acidiferrimicrobium sp. IK]MCU4183726.1 30S ribosomal protein S12 methylthiotransferase RimO [Acidiferrimicrobium sp. IK]
MRYWLETLGCPKNQVDSEKLVGTLEADGYGAASAPGEADLVVVNTCAFIEAARRESIDTVLALADARRPGAKLVVTGCMAERYGDELAAALPEVDRVAGFGAALAPPEAAVSVTLGVKPALGGPAASVPVPAFDLLNLPRPASSAPWAYVKVAEGCDRKCGFCAIPSFRGAQRSRLPEAIFAEVESLAVPEVVLVAQDLASYGRDLGAKQIEALVAGVAQRAARTRLLYLYPSDLTDGLIDVMGATDCHYFDLSLQHVSRPHLRRMRRWGSGERFLDRIADIRARYPDAAFRSSFIVGYPGETEEDHDLLLAFLEEARLDWAGFFSYSAEDGTYAAGLDGAVAPALMQERLAECSEIQDRLTAAARSALVGTTTRVLVDSPGVARSHREAPEIDGIINVPLSLPVGSFVDVEIVAADGPDLDAVPAGSGAEVTAAALTRAG